MSSLGRLCRTLKLGCALSAGLCCPCMQLASALHWLHRHSLCSVSSALVADMAGGGRLAQNVDTLDPMKSSPVSPVQVLAAEKAAKESQGAAAAELEAATKELKEQVQQLQEAANAAESRAAAAEKEAAKIRACVKSQADQLCSARAEAASCKKEAMSLVERISQLDKSKEVRSCLSAVCCWGCLLCILLSPSACTREPRSDLSAWDHLLPPGMAA